MSLSKAIFHLMCLSDVLAAVDNPWEKKRKLANARLSNFKRNFSSLQICGGQVNVEHLTLDTSFNNYR